MQEDFSISFRRLHVEFSPRTNDRREQGAYCTGSEQHRNACRPRGVLEQVWISLYVELPGFRSDIDLPPLRFFDEGERAIGNQAGIVDNSQEPDAKG